MITLYLAAAWARKKEIAAIRDRLIQIPGIYINSRWLGDEENAYYPPSKQSRAQMDVDDVHAADILVRFTDDLSNKVVPAGLATGARMFEMGYAYALGKRVVVVGGYQPIFDFLPSIVHVTNVDELEQWLVKEIRQ